MQRGAAGQPGKREISTLPQIPEALLCPEDAVIRSAKTPGFICADTSSTAFPLPYEGIAFPALFPARGGGVLGCCWLSGSVEPLLRADVQGASRHHTQQINYHYTKHCLCQLGTTAGPGNGDVPVFCTSGEKVKFCIIQVTRILTGGIGFSSRISHIHLLSLARV